MDQTLPIADEDPRGRPVVFRAGHRAENGPVPVRRRAVVRGAAVLGVAVSLLAGTTVIVSEVLAPSLPHAEAAPLWFRPPPLVDDSVPAGVPAAGPAAATSPAGDVRDDGTPPGAGTDRTGPAAVAPDRRSGRTGPGDDARGPSRTGTGTDSGKETGNGTGAESGKGTGNSNGTGSGKGTGNGTGSGKGTGNGNGSGKGTGSGRGSGDGTGHG